MSETLKDDRHDQEPKSKAPGTTERAKELLQQPRIRFGALAALLVVGAAVAWVVIGKATSSDQTSPPRPATATGLVALSANGLRSLAAVVAQPIYWAGPKKGYLYELTRTETRCVFIRYLRGTRKAELKIATYPYPRALQALKNVSHGREHSLPGGVGRARRHEVPEEVPRRLPRSQLSGRPLRPLGRARAARRVLGSVRPVS
jgi:hypothetical protein